MRSVLHIDAQLCASCAVCAARRACRTRAIVQNEQGDLPVIEDSRCRGCMVCVLACPNQAIRTLSSPASSSRGE